MLCRRILGFGAGRQRAGAAVLLAGVLAVTACGPTGSDPAGTDARPSGASDPAGGLSGSLTVFAASSLTESYTALADAFMDANPDVDVRLNFAGSAELVAQIAAGAPVDVIATADAASVAAAIDALDASDEPAPQSVRFATSTLQIVVEAGNPLAITSLADLADPDLVVVLCDESVPCGRYAAQALDASKVTLMPASREQSAKAVMSKVLLGEADAGIAYRTDVVAAGDAVTGIALPNALGVMVEYWMAARDSALAAAFAAFVLGAVGQETLASYGFGAP
ncbi:MAG: molybdate ABC transporter substrate-binding protein [Ilumatobacteraceae bacterium]